ncbi:MAG: phage virion morphogenesis protein [Gammaproteobacteria bacterium]|nr:phage virion morphogenesis protein [Gammaproteobacteria bacterium]
MSTAVRWEGQKEVGEILQKIATQTNDLSPVFESIGAVLVASTQERIATGKKSPAGMPWPALNPVYARIKAKKYPGIGMLQREDYLLDSITSRVHRDYLLVGSNKEYAARMQFGGDGVAARPYLGLSRDDKKAVLDLVKVSYEEIAR